jgi:hypothetical protein
LAISNTFCRSSPDITPGLTTSRILVIFSPYLVTGFWKRGDELPEIWIQPKQNVSIHFGSSLLLLCTLL